MLWGKRTPVRPAHRLVDRPKMFRSPISIKRDLGGLREVAPLHNLLRDQSGEAFRGAADRLDPVALEPLNQIRVANRVLSSRGELLDHRLRRRPRGHTADHNYS